MAGNAGSPVDAPAFLALGDSYTIGEGVDPAGRWPVQLAEALGAEGLRVGAPRIIATTGWTTATWGAAPAATAAKAAVTSSAPTSARLARLRGNGDSSGNQGPFTRCRLTGPFHRCVT